MKKKNKRFIKELTVMKKAVINLMKKIQKLQKEKNVCKSERIL